jgi:nucleoside-diphosphate-sugar epimerase
MTGFQKQEKILVTGGAGFIGSHLVEALLHRGQKVRILDDLSTGKVENLEEATGFRVPPLDAGPGRTPLIPLGEKAEFLKGDISDEETCRKACEGVSCVFHEAALGSVQRSVEDPLTTHRVNATGTMNMLWAAKEAGVRRFLYASSSSVFGNLFSNPEEVIPKEETHPTHPESPYAATKLMGELYCRIFSRIYGLETVSLRYFNVFGPRQDPKSLYAAVIPRFMHALLHGAQPVIYGDGNQSRDFTFVENVVQANLLAMEAKEVSGKVFNIACGQGISVNHLLSRLQAISGKKIPPQYEAARSGEIRHSLSSTQMARRDLGFEPEVPFAEGLAVAWDWFQKKGI